jgi:hypothetical protein
VLDALPSVLVIFSGWRKKKTSQANFAEESHLLVQQQLLLVSEMVEVEVQILQVIPVEE